MTRGRYVVCGKKGAGKSTWVTNHARMGDYRWDLDCVAACLTMGTPTLPATLKGKLPGPTVDLVLRLREGFIDWLADVGPLGDARVFIIVHDEEVAHVIAHELGARLVHLDERHRVTWRG